MFPMKNENAVGRLSSRLDASPAREREGVEASRQPSPCLRRKVCYFSGVRNHWKGIALDVPILRQTNWCSCGIASINMAMRHLGLEITEKAIERNRLVTRDLLQKYGFNPGRLGRIALSYGFDVTIIDPDGTCVGSRFLREGGRWQGRSPCKEDLYRALERNVAPVICIPNKEEAFEGSTSGGSHWVTIHSFQGGEFLLHDPSPWRKATRCKPGYWDRWDCSAILIKKPGSC